MDDNKWTEDQQFAMGIVKIGGDAVKEGESNGDSSTNDENGGE